MKRVFLLFLLALSVPATAQIAKIESDQSRYDTGVTDIVVVFKMHVDVGYTNWAEAILQYYATDMLENTLKSIEETAHLPENERFVWTIPSWPLHYMLENARPDLLPGLEKAVRDGRIIPHALPTTYETDESDLESLVRGLHFASDINRRFGKPEPRHAKLTDVPSHSWVLPTLLKNGGVDILHIGCNPGSTSPDIPTLFWWEGVGGSKLLTFNWAEYYGSGILPPEGWPHKTWLAMIHTHENTGAPDPKEVAKILREAKEKLPGVRIHIGSLADFHDLLVAEKPDLPVVRGDMPDTWIHGYLSMPRETGLSKKMQRYVYNAEMLNTMMSHWGIGQPIDAYVDRAVENMVLYDEHTFGIAMTHGNQKWWSYGDRFKINRALGDYDFAEASWREKGNRIYTAERLVTPPMRKQMGQLASSVAQNGKRVVVFNPLPWERDGRVKLFMGVYQKKFTVYGVEDTETGTVIPAYNEDNLLTFDATGIPPMGYKTYRVITDPVASSEGVKLDEAKANLENEYFAIRIDPATGALASVFDKKQEKELVDPNDPEGFARYRYDRYGRKELDRYNEGYVKPGSEGWANQEMGRPVAPELPAVEQVYLGRCDSIVYDHFGNLIRATVFGSLDDRDAQCYLVSYTLYDGQPYLEINWGVDGKRPDAAPEAGWLTFPFKLEKPECRLYRTGGIVDPNRDFVRNTNQDYYFLNTSMAMFDPSGYGVALNTPVSPGVSIDTPGLYHFTGEKRLARPKVYVNLFNTQWGTNFTEWIEGSFSSKVYVWSYGKYDSESTFITPSEETREPLYASYADDRGGSLPLSAKGVSLSRKGVLVTAYGNNRDGEGTVLRLWEQAGKDEKCMVELPAGSEYKTAYPCDLRGVVTDQKGIRIERNRFEVDVKANRPYSFTLR